MKYIVSIVLLLFSISIYAGVINNTKVVGMYCGYYQEPMCAIYFADPVENPPSCHTVGKNRMHIKGDDPLGKSILSLAMMAYAQEKTVQVSGLGSCNIWSNTEDLKTLFILPSVGTP